MPRSPIVENRMVPPPSQGSRYTTHSDFGCCYRVRSSLRQARRLTDRRCLWSPRRACSWANLVSLWRGPVMRAFTTTLTVLTTALPAIAAA